MPLFKRATPWTHVFKVEHGYFRLGTACTHAPLEVFCAQGGGILYFLFFFRSSASMLSCRSAVLPCSQPAGLALILSLCPSLCLSLGLSSCLTRRTDLNKLEVVFLHFEVWVADWKVFDVKFESSVSKSPRDKF